MYYFKSLIEHLSRIISQSQRSIDSKFKFNTVLLFSLDIVNKKEEKEGWKEKYQAYLNRELNEYEFQNVMQEYQVFINEAIEKLKQSKPNEDYFNTIDLTHKEGCCFIEKDGNRRICIYKEPRKTG